jgi:hypothetical protein
MQTPGISYTDVAMLCFATVATQANGSSTHKRRAIFDTDSEPIGVDNWCTGCILHRIEDFVGPLEDSKQLIKGFGGTRTSNIKIGTLAWKWLDNKGKTTPVSHTKIVLRSKW